MAFEGLSDKLNAVFKKLRGRGKLTSADVKDARREVRMALLEADVNYKVCKDFVKSVSERASGAEVMESLTPAQQVIKIVNEELTALMGGSVEKLKISSKPPTIVMLMGLQGAGKTTNGVKLAAYFKKQGKRPLMAACDVYRPAAIRQLQVAAESAGIPVFEMGQGDPVEIAEKALEHARHNGNDLLFLDTAGRLSVDEALMDELRRIAEKVEPTEKMLVVDAMTGQDAVNTAENFASRVGIDSVMLTKLDGDARGGAALSIRAVTGCPIKFSGIGEKIDASNIEPFYPDRMASRILGMGDVLTLIDKAQEMIDQKKAEELEQKIRKSRLSLDDFLDQMRQMKNMDMSQMLGMIPGMKGNLKNVQIDEKALARTEAIILSMTKKERDNPAIINSSRKKRIAAGSGTRVEDVNRMLKQFEQVQKLTKQMAGGFGKRRRGGFKMPFGM